MTNRPDLEALLNEWMEEHEGEIIDLLDEEMERFRQFHPGVDDRVAEPNALMMASRRFSNRALGAVLPVWLETPGVPVPGEDLNR